MAGVPKYIWFSKLRRVSSRLGKGHMCYLLQVLAKAITRLPSQKRAGKINKIMSHFLVSSTLPFIFFWLLASLCRMTWTFQFIIIYMIYSQKLSKKLLQGGTKSIDFCKSLIDLQNLYSARYFTNCHCNSASRHEHDKVIFPCSFEDVWNVCGF